MEGTPMNTSLSKLKAEDIQLIEQMSSMISEFDREDQSLAME